MYSVQDTCMWYLYAVYYNETIYTEIIEFQVSAYIVSILWVCTVRIYITECHMRDVMV